MWFRAVVWSAAWLAVTSVTHGDAQNGGQWGWHVSQAGPETLGHYFVKLPQSEQQVRYVADGSGYHGALAVVTNGAHHSHTANFALGQKAIELTAQTPSLVYNNLQLNSTPGTNAQPEQNSVEVHLSQQPYAEPSDQVLNHVPFEVNNLQFTSDLYPNSIQNPFYYDIILDNTKYNNQQADTKQAIIKDNYKTLEHVNNNDNIASNKNTPIVQVFKDRNCLKDDISKTIHDNSLQKSVDVLVDTPTYKEHNIQGEFGAREINKVSKRPTTQTHARTNAGTETIYYSTELSPTTLRSVTFTEDEGISKLVASTQDLISNDDLLRINYAAEKIAGLSNEDIIRPPRRFKNTSNKRERNTFLVSAKFANSASAEDQSEKDEENGLQTSANQYKFASPIVVEDPNYNSYTDQIVNNLVSTMVPYINDGYEIVGVRNTFKENSTADNEIYMNSNENLVAITPRPVGQNYLAPITVALRLLNSNNSNGFNALDDHEASDSEFVSNTVEHPQQQQVMVEIQKSIPVDITHINEVEYHEYLDEGRSNTENPVGLVKSLYQKYVASLDESNNNIHNRNNLRAETPDPTLNYDYGTNERDDTKDTVESSENIRSEVHVRANIDNNKGYDNYYENDRKEKIIQPIVIEKQVPVTTYVDRFIEKQVPYPTPYEVVKHVPVDRPVPIPVHFEKVVEKPVEVTRYVDKPYPVEVLQPFPVEVRVPYPVEHKVYVDRPVHIPYPVEKIIEKQMIHPVAVPTPIAVPVGIHVPVEKKVLYPVGIETPVAVPVPYEKEVPVEKVVEREVPVPYPVERKVPYPVSHEVKVPVPYPVEKRIPVTVEKIIEKPVTVTKFVEKPVHIKVPQPVPVEVHVPKPYPVDRIVERKVPYPVHVDRVIERKVPYPVKTVVEKIVDKPVYLTKYIDRPYPVEKRVPYPVEKIVEKRVPYPVEVKVRYPVEKHVKKTDAQPYNFEKVDPSLYLYGYSSQGYPYQNQNQVSQEHRSPLQNTHQNYSNQQQAESHRNYQIQLLNANILRNIQNVPVQTTLWGNQYASSFQYLNATTGNNEPYFTPYSTQSLSQKYTGPPPSTSSSDRWASDEHFNDRRKSDRTPKVANLRIEYGFKPPLIPSTEVDMDGLPVRRGRDSQRA